MDHVQTTFSPEIGQIANHIQSLQHDLTRTRQIFESSCRNLQDDIQRIESSIFHFMQQLQPLISQNRSPLESAPSSTLTDQHNDHHNDQDEQDNYNDHDNHDDLEYKDRKEEQWEQDLVLEGTRCPHSDCKGSLKRFKRRDNLQRHYTKHLPCEEKCNSCQGDIEWQYNRRDHIQRCLKPGNHHSLPKAKRDWRNALDMARTALDKSEPEKGRQRATRATRATRTRAKQVTRARQATEATEATEATQATQATQAKQATPATPATPATYETSAKQATPAIQEEQNQEEAPDRGAMHQYYTMEDIKMSDFTTDEILSIIDISGLPPDQFH